MMHLYVELYWLVKPHLCKYYSILTYFRLLIFFDIASKSHFPSLFSLSPSLSSSLSSSSNYQKYKRSFLHLSVYLSPLHLEIFPVSLFDIWKRLYSITWMITCWRTLYRICIISSQQFPDCFSYITSQVYHSIFGVFFYYYIKTDKGLNFSLLSLTLFVDFNTKKHISPYFHLFFKIIYPCPLKTESILKLAYSISINTIFTNPNPPKSHACTALSKWNNTFSIKNWWNIFFYQALVFNKRFKDALFRV